MLTKTMKPTVCIYPADCVYCIPATKRQGLREQLELSTTCSFIIFFVYFLFCFLFCSCFKQAICKNTSPKKYRLYHFWWALQQSPTAPTIVLPHSRNWSSGLRILWEICQHYLNLNHLNTPTLQRPPHLTSQVKVHSKSSVANYLKSQRRLTKNTINFI